MVEQYWAIAHPSLVHILVFGLLPISRLECCVSAVMVLSLIFSGYPARILYLELQYITERA